MALMICPLGRARASRNDPRQIHRALVVSRNVNYSSKKAWGFAREPKSEGFIMTVNYSYRLLAVACAVGTLHLVGACASDQAAPSADAGPEAATGAGGKHTGGAAGRPSTGGSA